MKKPMISRRSFLKAGAFSAALSAAGVLSGCSASAASAPVSSAAAAEATAAPVAAPGQPKYIFLFIGDGMGNAQTQLASYYLGANKNSGGVVKEELSFMQFPAVGSITTYDSSSFCPDSASTATSIATGNKTLSGVINMDTTKTTAFETISEKLHAQCGYKIGVISTVNINHATPAAFYAHQASRGNYYEIGEELVNSGFEYFAGGAFLSATGADKDKTDLAALAEAAGYKVAATQTDADALTAADEKVLILSETVADGGAMSYAMDTAAGEWSFTDYVKKGIDQLTNDTGFFMMAESGKIDWACHANDAAASIHDVVEMSNAVDAAVAFYNAHPDETLVLVTADHETGGLAIGYATTNYDTFLTNLASQTISYAKFDTDYVTGYCEKQTKFEDVLPDVKACFGLMTADDADATEDSKLVLTEYELEELKLAYERTLAVGKAKQGDMTQQDYELYGTYQPFSMTLCHLINHKSGLDHTTYAHTGSPVALYALGCGSEKFNGVYDNTDIYNKLAALTGVN